MAQLMDGSAGPGIKWGRKECGAGSRGGMGAPHQQWPAPGLAHLTTNYLALLKLCGFCLICSSFLLICTLNGCYMGFFTRLGFF